MAKTSKKEYEMLKSLRDSWKWIARDGESNSLNVFSVKPIKTNIQWNYTDVGYKHAGLTKEENKMFQFIRWEDEEPYSIAELTGEYESEETEVKKDKEKYIVALPSEVEHDDMWPKVALSKLANGKLKVHKTSRQTDLTL